MRSSERSHIRTFGSFFSKFIEKEREKEKVQRKSHQKVGVGSLEIEEKVAERAVVVATVALHKSIFKLCSLDCNVLHLIQTCSVESFGAFIKFGLIDSLLEMRSEN